MIPHSEEHISSEICRFLSNMAGEQISAHDDLKAKGVDSVALLELVIFMERELKIPFPLDLLTSAPLTSPSELTARLLLLHAAGVSQGK